jgi:hypothetical protein
MLPAPAAVADAAADDEDEQDDEEDLDHGTRLLQGVAFVAKRSGPPVWDLQTRGRVSPRRPRF